MRLTGRQGPFNFDGEPIPPARARDWLLLGLFYIVVIIGIARLLSL